MDTVELKLSLEGIESPEVALVELQKWLQDAGISAELHLEPPTEVELGGKATALLLVFSLASEFSHLPPSIVEGLRQVHEWQQQHQKIVQPVIHSTGHKELDEDIEETIQHAHWHIELREPEPPPRKKAQVIAPPPKKKES